MCKWQVVMLVVRHPVRLGGDDSNQGVVDEVTITPILQDEGQPVCELVETPKLKKRRVPNRHGNEMRSHQKS